MKIGLCTDDFQARYGYEEAFSKLREIGYEGADFTFGRSKKPLEVFSEPREVWTKEFTRAKRALNDAGMTATQSHATFPTDLNGEQKLTDETAEQLKKEIEAAAIIGSPYIVIHPIKIASAGKDTDLDYERNIEAFSKLEPFLKEHGIIMGLENLFTFDYLRDRYGETGCSSPESMIKYLDGLNSDSFAACLDTGHMFITGVQPASAVRKLGKKLKLLHVHDNYGTHDNHSIPGFGAIDWQNFAASLKETGYDGCFSLEIMCRNLLKIDEEFLWDFARLAYKSAKKITENI